MKHTIETNARLITALHARIHETHAVRTRSQEDFENWQRACADFRRQYNSLAFPGGLDEAYTALRNGDLLTAETAICFLEIHPYFFFSQYIGTKLTRPLKRLTLPAHLQHRLDTVPAARRAYSLARRSKKTDPEL